MLAGRLLEPGIKGGAPYGESDLLIAWVAEKRVS